MKQFFLIIFFICAVALYAQEQKHDIIIKIDGTKLEAVVQEVDIDIIKYKVFDNIDGPIYSMKKEDIATILYSNGAVDVFRQNFKTPENEFIKNPANSEKKYAYESIYYSAKGIRDGGAVLCALGSATIISGLFVGLFADWVTGLCIMMPVGAAMLIPGAIMTGVGNRKMRNTESKMLSTYSIQLNKGGIHPVNLSFATNGLTLRF